MEWLNQARQNQLPPTNVEWDYWLLQAGRGFGKTRSGAEWLAWEMSSRPDTRWAIVAPTYADARDTCVEGESGLLRCLAHEVVDDWKRSMGELVLTNGARAKLFAAEEPDRLRGPQHHGAWCFIAGTMVATPDGERTIETIRRGDPVLTRDGPRLALGNASRAAVVGQVRFDNGQELVGTADHPVYTSRGWTNLSDLQSGDRVCALSASNGAASVGIATATGGDRITSGRTSLFDLSAPFDFIAKYGSILTGLFPRASKSTTPTTTKRTTTSTILSAFRSQSTRNHTALLIQFLASIGPQSRTFAYPAMAAARASGARQLASQLSAGPARSSAQKMLANSPKRAATVASCSGRALELTAVSVVSTWRPMAVKDVFCLKVEGAPEYFANGVLVHNCDELSSWRYADAWDQLLFGLRLGDHPQVAVTTTPKPNPLTRSLLNDRRTVITRGSTFDNAANLAKSALDQLRSKYEGTRLGRQELYAELLDDVPGALWTRAMIEKARWTAAPPSLRRVVISVDPSGSDGETGDSQGIIAAGIGHDGRAYVIEDATTRAGPDEWARRTVDLYHKHKADLIVAERNFGGEMVRRVIQTVGRNLPVKLVTASRGKAVRAEPVSALYEQGKVSHLRPMPDLEDQMINMTGDGFVGMGSPDRLDAMVWALTELMLQSSDATVVNVRFGG